MTRACWLVLLAVLSGCAGTTATPTVTPTGTPTVTPAPAAGAPTGPAPAAATPATATSSAPSATAAPAAPCPASAIGQVSQSDRLLRERMGPDGETPLMATDVAVVNVSAAACYLSGWPGLTLVGDATRKVCTVPGETGCGAPVDRVGVPPQRVEHLDGEAAAVTLAPGATTSFSVVYDGVVCLRPAYRMDLRVPGDDRAIEVPHTSICNSDPVQVAPFGVLVDPPEELS